MGGRAGQTLPGSGRKPGTSDKVKIAYISMVGVIVAALISGLFLYLANRNSGKSSTPTSNNKVIVNVAPSVAPPPTPSFRPFQAPVFNLAVGRCAYVFSEPQLLSEDRLGCVDANTTVSIYCTVESTQVGNTTVWDEIYYRTDWGTTAYIPDYYVDTGTNNAVMSSCVT
jgi:hypothetical protein